MVQISKLSEHQLKKRIQETQAELTRRASISKATHDIAEILKKYNLSQDDINFKNLISKSSTSSQRKVASKPSNQKMPRAKVEPKFKSLDAVHKWTGRGKAPRWVVAICEAENLSIEAFKTGPRFKI